MIDGIDIDKIKKEIEFKQFKTKDFGCIRVNSIFKRHNEWMERRRNKEYVYPRKKLMEIVKQKGVDYLRKDRSVNQIIETTFMQNIKNCAQLIALQEASMIIFSQDQIFHFKKGSIVYHFPELNQYWYEKKDVISQI